MCFTILFRYFALTFIIGLFLDGIISVLDAETLAQHLQDDCEEIAISDCILVSDSQNSLKRGTVEQIRPFNLAGECLPLCDGEIDLNQILNLDSFGNLQRETIKDIEQVANEREGHNQITSVCLVHENPMDKQLLLRWFSQLVWEDEESEYFRTRGVIHVGNDIPFVLQQLNEMLDFAPMKDPWHGSPSSKLVITGRNLKVDSLMKGFKACELSST